MRFTKDDLKWFILILISFSLIVFVLIPFLDSVPQTDYAITYIAFIAVYSLFVVWFFKLRISPKIILGIALLFLASDIVMPPLLVTPQGPIPMLPGEASFSSDIFIYQLLPTYMPSYLRYLLTYIMVPAIMILLAKKLLTKQMFYSRLV